IKSRNVACHIEAITGIRTSSCSEKHARNILSLYIKSGKTMNIWIIVAIIVLVLGLIIGNILLLKQSVNQKLSKPTKDNNESYDRFEDKDD
ncbi:MAG: DUF2897 family protein, partial [Paraglaciecola sp.]|uniref:DUF2897 family protein n=1 Tax=Paraglaciecola sp. TaxID=1920173 RepID=UPI003297390E